MADENAVYSITVYLDSGATLNGYVYQGNAIDDGFWLTYSSTADMRNAVLVSREKIQYFEITEVANTAGDRAHGVGDLGDLSLRRCGRHKFSAENYSGRPIPQLLALLNEVTDMYMVNRDLNWYCKQTSLIDEAVKVAYSKGQY